MGVPGGRSMISGSDSSRQPWHHHTHGTSSIPAYTQQRSCPSARGSRDSASSAGSQTTQSSSAHWHLCSHHHSRRCPHSHHPASVSQGRRLLSVYAPPGTGAGVCSQAHADSAMSARRAAVGATAPRSAKRRQLTPPTSPSRASRRLLSHRRRREEPVGTASIAVAVACIVDTSCVSIHIRFHWCQSDQFESYSCVLLDCAQAVAMWSMAGTGTSMTLCNSRRKQRERVPKCSGLQPLSSSRHGRQPWQATQTKTSVATSSRGSLKGSTSERIGQWLSVHTAATCHQCSTNHSW